MITERVIEIPWCLQQIPQSGRILDIGSCDALYLRVIQQPGRELHCLDPRDCSGDIPPGAVFHHQSLIGNTLPRRGFDAVVAISTIEHIGLPCYAQEPFQRGDALALAEIRELLKPGAPAVVTVPAGQSKLMTWYRQYSSSDLHRLFRGWRYEIRYWGFVQGMYRPIPEDELELYDYRDRLDDHLGAGALAAIVAYDS